MNREYLSAKAELCSKLAVEQINNGNEEEGVKNLKRMVRALNDIHLINYTQGRRDQDTVGCCLRCNSWDDCLEIGLCQTCIAEGAR